MAMGSKVLRVSIATDVHFGLYDEPIKTQLRMKV